MTTIPSRQFNQDSSGAKKAADKGPVIITDRGRPAHVLMTFQQYLKLTGESASILDLLAMPGIGKIDFKPPRVNVSARPAKLT